MLSLLGYSTKVKRDLFKKEIINYKINENNKLYLNKFPKLNFNSIYRNENYEVMDFKDQLQ